MGEVSRFVYFKEKESVNGIGRILVTIIDKNGKQVVSVLTEGDGYFNYLGLSPGNYTAKIDENHLTDLGSKTETKSAAFEIEISEFGDITDNLEFILIQKSE